MSALILVATPHTAFGELLRISLEDSAQYHVRLAQTAREARAVAGKSVFQLAILDSALADEPFIPFCFDLLELQPGIRLVIVPPDNNPNHSSLGGLIPHGYLSRPFYLPDLIDVVSHLLSDREKQLRGKQGDASAAAPGEALRSGAPEPTLPPWLQEPLTLQGYLEKELGSTQARAGMVGMHGLEPNSGTLRAVAGSLDEPAAQELSSIIFRYWNGAEKTDLMRFVRLSSGKKDFLVYATQVTGDMVLILVYDNTSPLSQIRPQTKAMAQSLVAHPPEGYMSGIRTVYAVAHAPANTEPAEQEVPAQPEVSAEQEVSTEPEAPARQEVPQVPSEGEAEGEETADLTVLSEPLEDAFLLDRLQTGFPSVTGAPQPKPPAVPSKEELPAPPVVPPVDDSELEEEPFETDIINISALLGSVPSPDPDTSARRDLPLGGDWVLDRSASASIPTLPGGYNGFDHSSEPNEPKRVEPPPNHKPLAEMDTPPEAQPPAETPSDKKARLPQTAPLDPQAVEETARRRKFDPSSYPTPPSGRPASLEVDTEPPVKPSIMPSSKPAPLEIENENAISPLVDTQPNVVSAISNLNQLEPVSPALSLLNYTCVLVPRLPQHYLTGELAEKLAAWVQQLCLAFGWRLEGISIRPEYLQWTVQVAPAISPGNLVRIIRQRTSQHIFSSFPGLATHNPSGDFWAIGYLIVSGVQPPSAQLLRDYIAQTRKRQGSSK